MRKETDDQGRRWLLKLETESLNSRQLGVIAELPQKNILKLTTMVNKRVMCIAKNYKMDSKVKENMMTDTNRRQTMEFEAPPIDQQEPLYMSLHKGDISDASSEEEGKP